LTKPVMTLGQWAVDHQREIEAARARFDERNGAASSDELARNAP
jgi:hypothetical protein